MQALCTFDNHRSRRRLTYSSQRSCSLQSSITKLIGIRSDLCAIERHTHQINICYAKAPQTRRYWGQFLNATLCSSKRLVCGTTLVPSRWETWHNISKTPNSHKRTLTDHVVSGEEIPHRLVCHAQYCWKKIGIIATRVKYSCTHEQIYPYWARSPLHGSSFFNDHP